VILIVNSLTILIFIVVCLLALKSSLVMEAYSASFFYAISFIEDDFLLLVQR